MGSVVSVVKDNIDKVLAQDKGQSKINTKLKEMRKFVFDGFGLPLHMVKIGTF